MVYYSTISNLIEGGENLADNIELVIGHLSKDQADLLPSLAINDGQVIYHEKDGVQFADYLGKRHVSGSVVKGIFNGSEYVDFSTADLDTIINTIKTTEAVKHGQLLNISNSIFMYKNINGNNFIVKINDTEASVSANTAGYVIHIPEYTDGDNVIIDMVISIYDTTHGEKIFFVKIENGVINYDECQDLDGEFVPGDLGISVIADGGLIAIVSTLDSNLKVLSYSIDSTGSAINNGFYIAAGDMKLIFEWMSGTTLPYNVYNSSAVVYNNEIHLLGGNGKTTAHYKWNGTSWTSVSTVPVSLNGNQSAVVYNGEIHILGGTSTTAHYKWNGTSWTSVSTLPYAFNSGCAVVYDNEIHILGSYDNNTKHYRWNGTRWISASTLPFISVKSNAVIYNNELHLLGSSSASSSGVNGPTAHYKWNGTSWTSVSTLPYAFDRGKAVTHNGMIHILGSYSYALSHYIWAGSEWKQQEDLPYEFCSGEAVSWNNELHLLGSYANNSTANATKHYILAIT